MTIIKVVRNSVIIGSFVIAAFMMNGCGGVNEEMMAELNNLRSEVSSLETEASSLKDERARLEREMAEKNAKLQQCAKDKETTQANLQKLPK
jgi:chromosome segregation ATPase